MKRHAELIDDLGGGTVLADAIAAATGRAVNRDAVYMWKKTGIPWFWRDAITAIAEKQGVSVPRGFANVQKRKNGTAQC